MLNEQEKMFIRVLGSQQAQREKSDETIAHWFTGWSIVRSTDYNNAYFGQVLV